MDIIQECALAFERLLIYEYHFVIGRKGQLKEFYLIFDKLVDGSISLKLIQKSTFYEQMKDRILPLIGLEKMLDDNKLIFRYNEKIRKFSLIKADYLLEGEANEISTFLFLGKRNDDEKEQMCRTFFPVGDKDYTVGQPQYTLLKKEKRNLLTEEVVVQYDRLTPKEDKNSTYKSL